MAALQLASKQESIAKIVTLQLARSFESLQALQLAAQKVSPTGGLNFKEILSPSETKNQRFCHF